MLIRKRLYSLLLALLLATPPLLAAAPAEIRELSASETRVLQAYIAFYSRPPDPEGLGYWSGRLEADAGSLVAIIDPFAASEEFQQRFGHLDFEELIRTIYLRQFNREPDPEGAAFYLDALESGTMDLADIAMRIFDGAQSTDRDAVDNKTTAAAYFVSRIEEDAAAFPDDGEALAPLLRTITAAEASLTEAFGSIDRLLEGWGSPSTLVSFASQDALLDYLTAALQAVSSFPGGYPDILFLDGGAPQAPVEAAAPDVSFSTTTLQEAGVDEADSVKTDGRYLYIAGEQTGYCCIEPWFDGIPEVEPGQVRILEILDSPAATREVALLPSDSLQNPVDEFYLVTERDGDQPDLLVSVAGGSHEPIWTTWLQPWYWRAGQAEIGLFDVTDPETPAYLASIRLDGQLITTRRIGEMLYVVTRYSPSPDAHEVFPGFPDQLFGGGASESWTLDDLLPTFTLSPGGASGPLVSASTSFLPPADPDRPEQPTLVTVTAIDLRNPGEAPLSATVIGPTETVYVSRTAVYLATTRHSYDVPVDTVETDFAPVYPHRTDIHKLTLSAAGPSYKGSGRVVGHLGWEPAKKPFRMGEHNGVLRIATSVGDDWNGTASTRLTLLRESADSTAFTLEETASRDNIGKEGERLFASRFIGDRGYIVTFRITDPLYVYDLSDPTQIVELAEIEIEGYSDYLYPLAGDLLLGIGKDAVPDTASGDLEGRGAWYQGVKLALFDVSGSGRELSSLVLGKRGTESDALYNHHAVTLLPSPVPDVLRLALPIRLHDGDPPAAAEPWHHYPWKHTGLYLFELSTAAGAEGIANSGRVIISDAEAGDPVLYSSGGDRSVIVGSDVHYIHGGQVWSALWTDPSVVTGPK